MPYPPQESRYVHLSSLSILFTDAGDSGFLLPMALVGVAMLWFFHSRRLAWLLLRSVLLAGFLITALKVLFLSCAAHWVPGLLSPSGHACLSAVVYGTLGTVFAARPWPARALIGTLVVLFVATIAVSRVTLGVHTLLEVAVGLIVGGLAHWWFAHSYAKMAPLRVDAKTFGVALTVTVLVAFGVRLPAESFIRHLARRIAFSCDGAVAASGHRAVAAPQPPRSRTIRSSAKERALWS
jgi:membrane-associated phospholipid phosphatase